jgi:prepilin-type N-terminal cleavage/methylation domain-containing protein
MKTITFCRRNETAFTLVELLVVIAIIGLLAGLIVSLSGHAIEKSRLSRVKVELQKVETIIQNYKEKKGFYPPDNPKSTMANQLFYELTGTTYVPGLNPPATAVFKTVKGSEQISATLVASTFNVGGFVNTTQDPVENPVFSFNFSPGQYAEVSSSPNEIELLVCPVSGPNMLKNLTTGAQLNPWNYDSSSTNRNNTDSFDLWVDVIMRGKTNRICNWSAPIVL